MPGFSELAVHTETKMIIFTRGLYVSANDPRTAATFKPLLCKFWIQSVRRRGWLTSTKTLVLSRRFFRWRSRVIDHRCNYRQTAPFLIKNSQSRRIDHAPQTKNFMQIWKLMMSLSPKLNNRSFVCWRIEINEECLQFHPFARSWIYTWNRRLNGRSTQTDSSNKVRYQVERFRTESAKSASFNSVAHSF